MKNDLSDTHGKVRLVAAEKILITFFNDGEQFSGSDL